MITDVSTNIARELTTNQDGIYEAFGLRSGNYKVTVNPKCFSTMQISTVDVYGGSSLRSSAMNELNRVWNPGPLMPLAFQGDDSSIAEQSLLRGAGTWGLNTGRKIFQFGERVAAELGADINSLFNHTVLSPDAKDRDFYNVGTFSLKVNPITRRTEVNAIARNPNFGRLIDSYAQDTTEGRPAIRLRLRIRF